MNLGKIQIQSATEMIEKPRIYADFNKLDRNRSAILTCIGTRRDIDKQGLILAPGLEVRLYMPDDLDEAGNLDSLEVDAVIQFSDELNCWVGSFEWAQLNYRSERDK